MKRQYVLKDMTLKYEIFSIEIIKTVKNLIFLSPMYLENVIANHSSASTIHNIFCQRSIPREAEMHHFICVSDVADLKLSKATCHLSRR